MTTDPRVERRRLPLAHRDARVDLSERLRDRPLGTGRGMCREEGHHPRGFRSPWTFHLFCLSRNVTDERPRRRKLDGAGEARLIAMACGEAPAGRARWTLKLLAGQLVELAVVDGISYETVRRTLKNELKPHTNQY